MQTPPFIPPTREGDEKEMMIEKIINVLIIVSTISAIIGILQFFGLNYETWHKMEDSFKAS